jgi:hypothetical protein
MALAGIGGRFSEKKIVSPRAVRAWLRAARKAFPAKFEQVPQ